MLWSLGWHSLLSSYLLFFWFYLAYCNNQRFRLSDIYRSIIPRLIHQIFTQRHVKMLIFWINLSQCFYLTSLLNCLFVKGMKLFQKHLLKNFILLQIIYDSAIKWLTKKTSSLFPLKDKIQHPSCKIYRSDCSCGEVYTGQLVKQTAMEQLEFRAGKMEWWFRTIKTLKLPAHTLNGHFYFRHQ